MSQRPSVALAQDLLLHLAKLPSAVQGRVAKWALLFQTDPTASGMNYEKINGAKDPNLRSVRIDRDWRGIVFKPPQGNIYVLLYVDHHDDAYRWAENRRITVNPITGAMQVIVTENVVESRPESMPAHAETMPLSPTALFAGQSDDQLVSLGIPPDYLERVRAITSEDELDALQGVLPVEGYEGLFLVAAGDTVSQILMSRETRVDRAIDIADFATALETPESQARFVVVDSDADLMAILNAPLAQWRVFLHPTQRRLATTEFSGPARVLGGAGTGKTVLAMHRAKWLADRIATTQKKVLFTTFTKNLALDVEANLRTLCSPDQVARIECRNLDSWAYGYLRRHRYEHTIVYGRGGKAEVAWERALSLRDPSLDLRDQFYVDELEQVILAQGITTREEYRLARRVGRGQILSRKKRDLVWPVFEEYRAQLSLRKLKEVDDAYRDAAVLLAKEGNDAGYAAIIVDETQDLGPQALKLLRAMIPVGRNDLFFVGDGHQRIYKRNRAALGRNGVDIRGRARKLYLNYRTTEQIRRAALALLEGCEIDDLDEGADENRRYRSLTQGPVPEVLHARTIEEAIGSATTLVERWKSEGEESASWTTAVVAPTHQMRDAIRMALLRSGFTVDVVEAEHKDSTDPAKIYVSTMHRAKGLEFDQVVVAASEDTLGPASETADQRRLAYVAVTRAKRRAALVWFP